MFRMHLGLRQEKIIAPYVNSILEYEPIKKLRTAEIEKIYAVFIKKIGFEYTPLLAVEFGSGNEFRLFEETYKPDDIIGANKKIQSDGIVIVHNHPRHLNRMVKAYPSKGDIKCTIDCGENWQENGCILLDHIIINEMQYYSFYENGLIKHSLYN